MFRLNDVTKAKTENLSIFLESSPPLFIPYLIETLIMDYQSIWEDCIYKMEDLGCSIDELSATELPKLPLGQDCCVGPIILSVMNDVVDLEGSNE